MAVTASTLSGLLHASDLNAAVEFGRINWADKTLDQTVNNSTTPIDDTELYVPVVAGAKYRVEAWLIATGNASADIAYSFDAPAGCSLWWSTISPDASDAAYASGTTGKTQFYSLLSTSFPTVSRDSATNPTYPLCCLIKGRLSVGATAGDFQLMWTQYSANASDTKLLAGSHLSLTRYA